MQTIKEIRLEVNLDCSPDIKLEELIKRIKYGCNVYGVIRVQSVLLAPKYQK